MNKENIAEKINQTIEDIWISLEKKEGNYINYNLSNQQHVLLTLIIRHPSSSPTELAERMGVTKSALSQQLAKLEMDSFIFRKPYLEDKRSYTIELDEKGFHYKNDMEAFNRKVYELYQANLSTEELTNILSSLSKLREILEQL